MPGEVALASRHSTAPALGQPICQACAYLGRPRTGPALAASERNSLERRRLRIRLDSGTRLAIVCSMVPVPGGIAFPSLPRRSEDHQFRRPYEARSMTTQTDRQEYTFQAEIKQLLASSIALAVSEPGDRGAGADLQRVGCARQDEICVAHGRIAPG